MINYIITFFLLAILASFLGFREMAGTFSHIAKILAIVFVVLFIGGLIKHLINGKRPPTI